MPRQDVPYGGAICRLKERIAELFDLVGQKLHSINGVKGDGQGDVKILSDDPAVVITNDAAQNEIKIGLDSSELPSAAVSSVNGETGAVVLDGNDIDAGFSTPGTTVTQALGSNAQQLQVIGGLVQQEILDRQNGDAALQTNINAVQAGIPAAAAAAVAADPTVAQLAVDMPNKVDKITSGNTKRAYTHTGAVQDDTPVVDGTDANSIGLRDANGRMKGADPASGATDKTFTTANWVSQTGDNAPNNLIHKTGNETKTGIFACDEIRQRTYYSTKHVTTRDLTSGTYAKIFTAKITNSADRGALIMWNNTRKGLPSQNRQCGIISIGGRLTTVQIANIAGTVPSNEFAITRKVNNTNDVDVTLWATGQIKIFDILFECIGSNALSCFVPGDLSTTNDFTSYDEVIYL